MFRPSILISPESNGISRLTIFNAVVLPPPEGPTRTQNAPAGISSDRSSTAAASRPAYRFVTWSKTISAAADIPDPRETDEPAGADEANRDPHGEPEPCQVERVGAGRYRRADDRDPEQSCDPRDRVVDAARDARVALVRVGENRRRQRRDDQRQADGEHEERRQELVPVVEAGLQPDEGRERRGCNQRPSAHEEARPEPHRQPPDTRRQHEHDGGDRDESQPGFQSRISRELLHEEHQEERD